MEKIENQRESVEKVVALKGRCGLSCSTGISCYCCGLLGKGCSGTTGCDKRGAKENLSAALTWLKDNPVTKKVEIKTYAEKVYLNQKEIDKQSKLNFDKIVFRKNDRDVSRFENTGFVVNTNFLDIETAREYGQWLLDMTSEKGPKNV